MLQAFMLCCCCCYIGVLLLLQQCSCCCHAAAIRSAFSSTMGEPSSGQLSRKYDRYRCSTTAVCRRVARLENYNGAAIPDRATVNGRESGDADEEDNVNNDNSVGHYKRQQHHHQAKATIFELEHNHGKEDNTLAVYGELHRLLGTDRSRRLLGPDTVAIMTTLKFLVVHSGGGQWWNGEASTKKGDRRGGSRLALGDRLWDVCGLDKQGPTMDSLMKGSWRERELPIDTISTRRLKRTIESVAKVASITEVFPVELQPTAPPPQNKRGDSSLRSVAGNTRRSLQRFYARVQAKRALARTASSSPPGLSARNPLMLIGVGALLSPRDCDIIVDEAQSGQGEWVSWDGDAGEGSTATSLHDLPESRALWEGKAGDTVCARIANVYGVQNSSVVVDTRDVFVCRVAGGGCEGANKLDWGRRMAWGTSGTVDAQQRQQQQQCLVAAEFRRSSSLITFFVELSAGETKTASWAACLEQRRQCFRLCGQGAGVILSGKLRHATVPVLSPDRAGERPGRDEQTNPSVVLLRGFASIRHRCIREDFALWRWGCPAWHVDAPWVKDEGILNRVWVARESDGGADEAGESPPAITTAAEGGGATMVSAVAASGGHYLERMNSSLAHRYYKQGLAGIDVPVLDDKGRPVIDLLLIEDRPLLLRVLGSPRTPETTVTAELRRRFPWSRARRRLGKAGLSTEAGISPRMDAALQELFGASLAEGERFDRVPVPPIKYVFVDPRYRGLGLGRRLFLEAMCVLARKGFRFALIVVEDNGSGGLFGFYEEMGFVGAEEQLGLPRAMIAPIPPPDSILASAQRI